MAMAAATYYCKNSIKRLGVYYKQCLFYRRGWAFIINDAFFIEGDGCLLEATLLGNIQI